MGHVKGLCKQGVMVTEMQKKYWGFCMPCLMIELTGNWKDLYWGNIHNCVALGGKVLDITKSEFSHLYLGNRTHLPTYLPYWAAVRIGTCSHISLLAACLSHAGTWRVVFMLAFLAKTNVKNMRIFDIWKTWGKQIERCSLHLQIFEERYRLRMFCSREWTSISGVELYGGSFWPRSSVVLRNAVEDRSPGGPKSQSVVGSGREIIFDKRMTNGFRCLHIYERHVRRTWSQLQESVMHLHSSLTSLWQEGDRSVMKTYSSF